MKNYVVEVNFTVEANNENEAKEIVEQAMSGNVVGEWDIHDEVLEL